MQLSEAVGTVLSSWLVIVKLARKKFGMASSG